MKTNEFLELLRSNPSKSLLFEYKEGYLVGANYHITEVKNIIIDAIDCGANTDYWKETIVQLWESPKEKGKRDYMTTDKALAILDKVDRIKPMEKEVEIKFEYSNPSFHTAQLFVNGHSITAGKLVLRLGVERTDCKAKATCGQPVEKIEQEVACCTPGTGCC
ncbi:hypothetical protein HPE56_17260 [Maribacter sp. ANRC-HE7]|uniref:Uncharacterized protein n=1 Tax=Maribacter aquimaris TaxID=2737171 RepID=A0ABR7V8S7_9FLAO|nr:DUF6428 family protein [Maribacter aquimaris]MBD0779553.1 hypothetical protein [Maribacter aquimaris]